MVQPLFPRFLESDREYEAAEAFWASLFHELIGPAGGTGDWKPWRSNCYVNPIPVERDGNPIFAVVGVSRGRALQVIQWAPESDGVEIAAWVAQVPGPPEGAAEFIDELTINLSLSDESARLARRLVALWLRDDLPVCEMAEQIRQILPTYDPGSLSEIDGFDAPFGAAGERPLLDRDHPDPSLSEEPISPYPNLYQLMAAYFHQDWPLDDLTWQGAVGRYARDTNREERDGLRGELAGLLRSDPPEEELRRIVLSEMGGQYDPAPEQTMREWLTEILGHLESLERVGPAEARDS